MLIPDRLAKLVDGPEKAGVGGSIGRVLRTVELLRFPCADMSVLIRSSTSALAIEYSSKTRTFGLKRYTDAMREQLLENARRQAEKASRSVRAAGLLRIARVEAARDVLLARQTLLQGLDAVRKLENPIRENLLDEARGVAAAISPELLATIPDAGGEWPEQFTSFRSVQIIQIMLTHGHTEAAFEYVIHQNDPESFPFFSVGAVLHRLDPKNPESATRRMMLLNRAVELWRRSPSGPDRPMSGPFDGPHRGFLGLFGHFWKEFLPDEAVSIARAIVDRAAQEPDSETSCGYPSEIHFSSCRQETLFEILHVLRQLDPALAQSLVDSHDQLAVAARRYPNGLETIQEESEAETKRLVAEGATCESGTCGGYVLCGDPADFDLQRRLIDGARNGDFASSIEGALEKYRQDVSPDAPNYAPKEFWPSTGAFRWILYQAGQRLGAEAAGLLEKVPDDDLRLFAVIELAAALAGVPPSSITSMKDPNPPGTRDSQARITAASCTTGTNREAPYGHALRSPDGGLIRCPKCLFQPSDDIRWSCKCSHLWNTFLTAGECPACHFQWEETMCPHCGEMSEHRAWYMSEL
jgi:hypothetical protein